MKLYYSHIGVYSSYTRPDVVATCKRPTPKISRRSSISLPSENSSPSMNSNKITPNSPIAPRVASPSISSRPCGPKAMPASKNPTIEGTPKREHMATAMNAPEIRVAPAIRNSAVPCIDFSPFARILSFQSTPADQRLERTRWQPPELDRETQPPISAAFPCFRMRRILLGGDAPTSSVAPSEPTLPWKYRPRDKADDCLCPPKGLVRCAADDLHARYSANRS